MTINVSNESNKSTPVGKFHTKKHLESWNFTLVFWRWTVLSSFFPSGESFVADVWIPKNHLTMTSSFWTRKSEKPTGKPVWYKHETKDGKKGWCSVLRYYLWKSERFSFISNNKLCFSPYIIIVQVRDYFFFRIYFPQEQLVLKIEMHNCDCKTVKWYNWRFRNNWYKIYCSQFDIGIATYKIEKNSINLLNFISTLLYCNIITLL